MQIGAKGVAFRLRDQTEVKQQRHLEMISLDFVLGMDVCHKFDGAPVMAFSNSPSFLSAVAPWADIFHFC